MNKIVLEHYPADRLPDDVRRHFAKGASVTLEVREESRTPATQQPMTRHDLVTMLRAA